MIKYTNSQTHSLSLNSDRCHLVPYLRFRSLLSNSSIYFTGLPDLIYVTCLVPCKHYVSTSYNYYVCTYKLKSLDHNSNYIITLPSFRRSLRGRQDRHHYHTFPLILQIKESIAHTLISILSKS